MQHQYGERNKGEERHIVCDHHGAEEREQDQNQCKSPHVVLCSQKLFRHYTENTAFLKACRHCHETEQKAEGTKVYVTCISFIRLHGKHGEQGKKERDAEYSLSPDEFLKIRFHISVYAFCALMDSRASAS